MCQLSEIETCLAYTVLRDPDDWLGGPSTSYLQCFLCGADTRASIVQPDFPHWRIYGVLEDPEFYETLVAATGRPKLTIKWATALAMTHLSLADGFAKLRDDAFAWHNKRGINEKLRTSTVSAVGKTLPAERAEQFWHSLAKRPAMFMGGESGWMLYCFLTGMDRGGDWLGLPEMPRLRDIVARIGTQSERAYGSRFATYRVYNAHALLKWAGLISD